jgi:SAM-dependent methyltransferase
MSNRTGSPCGVCGKTAYVFNRVLWRELVDAWQLAPDEVDYIDRQQGEVCASCSSNLRSIALANAIRAHLGTTGWLQDLPLDPRWRDLAILELNEAGTLSPVLRKFPRHHFGAYPEVDMHQLPYPDGTFDVVVHSDTLEHVESPVHALAECGRVLRPGGALIYTVPVVVGRMTRSRSGLLPSYHGNSGSLTDDLMVHTEFGADAWTYAMRAGFSRVSIHAVEYPAGLAMLATR